MNNFQKNALFLTLLLLGLFGVAATGYSLYQSHQLNERAERMAWKKQNIRQLESLSRIGVLSSEEQDRLDRAGDDVDRIQQVLLDLHTERQTLWGERRKEVEDRAEKLHSVSYLAAYDLSGQYREAEAALRKDGIEVEENLDAFQQGLYDIRRWRPMPFEVFKADTSRSTEVKLSDQPVVQIRKPSSDEAAPTPPLPERPSLRETVNRSSAEDTSQNKPSKAQSALNDVDVEVAAALSRWSSAMETNDPTVIASCYAPHVDRYFLKLDLNNSQVASYITNWLGQKSKHIASFSTRDVTFENETSDSAKLRLIKELTVREDSGTTSSTIRSRLYLRKLNGEWKITSEQDFKN